MTISPNNPERSGSPAGGPAGILGAGGGGGGAVGGAASLGNPPGMGGGGGGAFGGKAPGIGGSGGADGALDPGIGGGGGADSGELMACDDGVKGLSGAGDFGLSSMADNGRGGPMVPKRIEARCLALPLSGRSSSSPSLSELSEESTTDHSSSS